MDSKRDDSTPTVDEGVGEVKSMWKSRGGGVCQTTKGLRSEGEFAKGGGVMAGDAIDDENELAIMDDMDGTDGAESGVENGNADEELRGEKNGVVGVDGISDGENILQLSRLASDT